MGMEESPLKLFAQTVEKMVVYVLVPMVPHWDRSLGREESYCSISKYIIKTNLLFPVLK